MSMPSLTEWKVPAAIQPRAEDYGFDLERALAAVVGLHSIIPPDAFTAETLGTERAGNGVLIGIGSLQLERERGGRPEHLNMIVPIDLLKPVLDDLRKFGRVNKPARPWLGMFSHEIENKIVVVGIADKGPAARAEFRVGDVIVAVNGEKISNHAKFYRKLWA